MVELPAFNRKDVGSSPTGAILFKLNPKKELLEMGVLNEIGVCCNPNHYASWGSRDSKPHWPHKPFEGEVKRVKR